MKIRALKTFQSAIVNMDQGDVKEVELDDYTYENWTANGLIEEVKSLSKKKATAAESVDPAPEAVTPNENQ